MHLVTFLTRPFDSATLLSLDWKYLWDLRTFSVGIFHWVIWKSTVFLFPVDFTQSPRKRATSFALCLVIYTKFEVDVAIRYLVIHFRCWYITSPCDLDIWPLVLNIDHISPVKRLTPPSTYPPTIYSWVISYYVPNWPLLIIFVHKNSGHLHNEWWILTFGHLGT